MQKVEMELLRLKTLLQERGETHGEYNEAELTYFMNGIEIKIQRLKSMRDKRIITGGDEQHLRDLAGYCILLLARLQE